MASKTQNKTQKRRSQRKKELGNLRDDNEDLVKENARLIEQCNLLSQLTEGQANHVAILQEKILELKTAVRASERQNQELKKKLAEKAKENEDFKKKAALAIFTTSTSKKTTQQSECEDCEDCEASPLGVCARCARDDEDTCRSCGCALVYCDCW